LSKLTDEALASVSLPSAPAPAEASSDEIERPRVPLLTIGAGAPWIGTEARDLWAHRDLFWFLAWRDVKVRYKQTVLGVSWAVLQPVLTMIIFTLLFGRLAHVPSEGEPYPIFVYAGLLPWNFFSTAVTNSSNSLVGNATLITKVYFPRLVIPGATVGAALVDFAIATTVLLAMMFYYGVAVGWSILMALPLVVLVTLVAIAVGMWMSALNVKYRDVRYALPFLMQIWLYVTPVIYPVSFIPRQWRWMLLLNPMTGVIEGFRSAFFARPFEWSALGASTVLTLALLAYAVFSFRRMEREFADII